MVRKSVDPQLPAGTPGGPGRADVGMGSNQIDRFTDRIEHFAAQARPLLHVPADGFGQLGGGRITEAKRLHRPSRSFSIRPLTCSQGSSRIVPASMASIRRSISTFHAASASGSAGPSRLARSSAASSARDAESKRSASANTAWVPLVIRRSYAPRRSWTSAGRCRWTRDSGGTLHGLPSEYAAHRYGFAGRYGALAIVVHRRRNVRVLKRSGVGSAGARWHLKFPSCPCYSCPIRIFCRFQEDPHGTQDRRGF